MKLFEKLLLFLPAGGIATVWTNYFLLFHSFSLHLERTTGCCSPLEHSQNSPIQKCCVSTWMSIDDVHSTPTFWC